MKRSASRHARLGQLGNPITRTSISPVGQATSSTKQMARHPAVCMRPVTHADVWGLLASHSRPVPQVAKLHVEGKIARGRMASNPSQVGKMSCVPDHSAVLRNAASSVPRHTAKKNRLVNQKIARRRMVSSPSQIGKKSCVPDHSAVLPNAAIKNRSRRNRSRRNRSRRNQSRRDQCHTLASMIIDVKVLVVMQMIC